MWSLPSSHPFSLVWSSSGRWLKWSVQEGGSSFHCLVDKDEAFSFSPCLCGRSSLCWSLFLFFLGLFQCLSFGGISKEPSFVSVYKVEPLNSWQVRWLARAPLSFYSWYGSPLTLGFFWAWFEARQPHLWHTASCQLHHEVTDSFLTYLFFFPSQLWAPTMLPPFLDLQLSRPWDKVPGLYSFRPFCVFHTITLPYTWLKGDLEHV